MTFYRKVLFRRRRFVEIIYISKQQLCQYDDAVYNDES
jgi:hypothetical protein